MYECLPFAKDISGNLIHISAVKPKEKKALVCPYCEASVRVGKGKRTSPYFAHRGCKPCYSSRDTLFLLLKKVMLFEHIQAALTPGQAKVLWNLFIHSMDRFDRAVFKPTLLYKELSPFHYESVKCPVATLDVLLKTGMVKLVGFNLYAEGYELTQKAQVYCSRLNLKEYHRLIQENQSEIMEMIDPEFSMLDDLRLNIHAKIIKALHDRMGKQSLYWLQINADKQEFYKIGLTSKNYEEEGKQVATYLKKHFQKISIKQVYWMEAMGSIAPYFRQRFEHHRYKIGRATEYFKFKTLFDRQKVKEELHQLYLTTPAHKNKIKQALKENKKVGKRGAESTEKFLQKPLSQAIIECFGFGLSIRQIAYECGCSKDTVSKVKRLWKSQGETEESSRLIDLHDYPFGDEKR